MMVGIFFSYLLLRCPYSENTSEKNQVCNIALGFPDYLVLFVIQSLGLKDDVAKLYVVAFLQRRFCFHT